MCQTDRDKKFEFPWILSESKILLINALLDGVMQDASPRTNVKHSSLIEVGVVFILDLPYINFVVSQSLR